MILNKFLAAVVVGFSLVASGAASATINPGISPGGSLGPLLSSANFGNSGISGIFSNDWTFSLGGTNDLTSLTDVVYNVTYKRNGSINQTFSDITNFNTALSAGNIGRLLSTGVTGDGDVVARLTQGNYTFNVSGTGGGSLGGAYSASLSVTPVPEPGEWAMMLAGLGLLGIIGRRRTRS